MSNPKPLSITVPLVPAYGRDYQSAADVMADWNANKDFRIQCVAHPYDGKYINKADAEMFGPAERYYVRYNALQDIVWVQHSDSNLVGMSDEDEIEG